MNQDNAEMWMELLLKVKINGSLDPVSEQDIAQFETDYNLCLPSDYKRFCQTFGSGELGGEWRIFSPTREMVDYSNDFTDWFKQRVVSHKLVSHPETDILALLSNCLVFGTNYSCVVAVWDFRSINTLDENCGIYLIQSEVTEEYEECVYRLGTSFYKFVLATVLDKSVYDGLPKGAKSLFGWPFLPHSEFQPANFPYVKPPDRSKQSILDRVLTLLRRRPGHANHSERQRRWWQAQGFTLGEYWVSFAQPNLRLSFTGAIGQCEEDNDPWQFNYPLTENSGDSPLANMKLIIEGVDSGSTIEFLDAN